MTPDQLNMYIGDPSSDKGTLKFKTMREYQKWLASKEQNVGG